MKKEYTLKNGYRLKKAECYDGYSTRTYWQIYKPNNEHYMNCGSYTEAYELACHLTFNWEDDF